MRTLTSSFSALWHHIRVTFLGFAQGGDDINDKTQASACGLEADSARPTRAVRASITLHQTKGNPCGVVQTMIFDSAEPDTITTLIEVPAPWTSQAMSALVLDELGKLHTYCRERQVIGDVYIGYKRVRDAIRPVQADFPGIHLLENLAQGDVAAVYRPAAAYRKAKPTHAQANPVPPQPAPTGRLAVATDGSAAINHHSGIGWACVAADGRHAIGNSRRGSNPTLAELNAIELALKTFCGPLDIHTDCRPAIDWINNPGSACNQQCYLLAKHISQLLARTKSSLVWVKGHAGHPLNETADRLARIARLELQGVYAGSASAVANRVAHELVLASVAD